MKIENIKFKAKSLLDGAWVQGDLIHKENGMIGILTNGFCVSEVDSSTVCQFTGLKDCKGNELYEHDVIENYPFIPSEIVWSEELSGYYLTYDNGKIYEKPLGYYLSLGKFIVVGNKFDKEK
nr:MAG TPA: YopX protein [Caudoviricetes sp.]